MIHSIYTHKEIFLRELISNASDAVDKLYFRSLTDDSVALKKDDFCIRISVDRDARTLTISDNGIIEGEENYYTANVREAIGKGNWGGMADEIAYSIANGFRNSKGHWSYVGSSKYNYMAVGVMYDGYYWYVCVCMDSENTDLK